MLIFSSATSQSHYAHRCALTFQQTFVHLNARGNASWNNCNFWTTCDKSEFTFFILSVYRTCNQVSKNSLISAYEMDFGKFSQLFSSMRRVKACRLCLCSYQEEVEDTRIITCLQFCVDFIDVGAVVPKTLTYSQRKHARHETVGICLCLASSLGHILTLTKSTEYQMLRGH